MECGIGLDKEPADQLCQGLFDYHKFEPKLSNHKKFFLV
jgi:hypothetical protein